MSAQDDGKARKISEADEFETLFNPATYIPPSARSPNVNPFDSQRSDFSKPKTDSNPIHTYWVRNQNLKDHLEEDGDILKKDQKSNNTKKKAN